MVTVQSPTTFSAEAEKARFLVEKAEQLKLAAIIQAEGDTQAADLMAQAFTREQFANAEWDAPR